MTRMTSAYANKLLRKLQEDKDYWVNKETAGSTYIAALDEEPVIPDYNYEEVAAKVTEIDEKIVCIKHAINLSNKRFIVAVRGCYVIFYSSGFRVDERKIKDQIIRISL